MRLLKLMASLRLNARVPELEIFPEPIAPAVPPLPSWSVPAEIVVVPVYVSVAASAREPLPDLVNDASVPEMMPL